MKTQNKLNQAIFLFFMVSGIALLQGCAVYSPNNFNPVTIPEIVKMSKDSLSSKQIIDEIINSRTAYEIKASEYAKLQQAGIPDSVINFMQESYHNLIRHQQQEQDSYYLYPAYPWYWQRSAWYFRPYGYYGWRW